MSGLSVLRSIRMTACGTMLAGLLLSAGAWGQDTSVSTTSQSGAAKITTDVARGKVAYVSGNLLVVKMEDGQVRDFTVPAGTKFNVDGKDLTISQLQPGMTLTRTLTTTTAPHTITTVRTIEGKVWHVNPPNSLILQFPDNTNKQYKIPAGQKFNVDGQMQTAFQLKKGMNISATVVTEEPMTVANQSRSITGTAPPVLPPAPPPNVATVLLIEAPRPAPAAAPVETSKATLPKTASDVPLMGVVGLMMLIAGFSVKKLRA